MKSIHSNKRDKKEIQLTEYGARNEGFKHALKFTAHALVNGKTCVS